MKRYLVIPLVLLCVAAVQQESFDEFVDRQPDSLLKANLLVVKGAHECGHDARLAAILSDFAHKELEELRRDTNSL